MPDRPERPPRESADQETRNDDPNVQDQREQRASGEKDQVEGERKRTSGPGERVNPTTSDERVNPTTSDERVNPEVGPRGDRKHNAREARRPGGGRKGTPTDER